jgi:hypothetical protein
MINDAQVLRQLDSTETGNSKQASKQASRQAGKQASKQ